MLAGSIYVPDTTAVCITEVTEEADIKQMLLKAHLKISKVSLVNTVQQACSLAYVGYT